MKKELYKVFQRAQAYISENYAAVLEQQDFDLIESYLAHFLEQGNVTVPGMERQAVLTRLVDEMTRYSFLTAYLDDPEVEEININAWDDVKVKYTDGNIRPAEEHFQTPEHARAVIRRVLGQSKMVWDNTQCIVVAHLPGNVRITAVGYDVLDEETALAVSIRKVNAQKLQKQDFIARETATEDMLDLLVQLYSHGVSLCLAGATDAGKSTLLGWLIKELPDNKRILTIEEGTRDFDCIKRDKAGNVLNNVVHLSAKRSDDPQQDITQARLVETLMTMNPDYIVVGESKGEETMQAVNAANTGHAVATTLHTQSAELTYLRLMSLCKMRYPNMDDGFLLRQVQQAFPIVAYLDCTEDHKRRVMEITEAVRQPDGSVKYLTLYEYVLQKNIRHGSEIEVQGYFRKVYVPSAALRKLVLRKGMTEDWIEKIFGKEF